MEGFLTALQQLLRNLPAVILWLVTVVFASAVVSFFLSLKIPRRYNVAVIGFHGSGKTTLITALFREILEGKIKSVQATLSTRSTTERVMQGIAKLDEGKPLGPTEDQDMFAYRTKIVLGSLLKKTYDVAIGDFPGRMSEQLAHDAVEPFLHPDFEGWCREADAFIFVIDVTPCFMKYESNKGINREYVIKMTAATRTAWQNLLNMHSAGAKRLKSYPAVLTFTKSDLINYVSDAPDATVTPLIERWGLSLEELPVNVRIDTDKLSEQQENILDEFSAVRTFFRQTNHGFREVFVSSVGGPDKEKFSKDEDVLKEPRRGVVRTLFRQIKHWLQEVFVSRVGGPDKEKFSKDKDVLKEPRLGLEELLRAVLPAPPS